MARPEPFLKNFGAKKSPGKVEEEFNGRQPEQLRQGHGTHEREVVAEHLHAVALL